MKKKTKNVKKAKNPKSSVKKADSKNYGLGIQPLGDRVLLKPFSRDEVGEKTISGIIIPDTVSKEKPEQGRVIAVGEGRWDDGVLIKPAVKVGDRVVFSRYGYDEIKYKGEEYYILKEENILAVLK